MGTPFKYWILIVLIISLNIVGYTVNWGDAESLQIFSDVLPIICSFIAVVFLIDTFKQFKQNDIAKKAWFLILTGVLMFFLAETTYSVLEFVFKIDMNENFPTYADIFWCIGYLPMIAGITMMFYGYKKSGLPFGDLMLYLFFSLFFLIIAIVVINFLLIPILRDEDTSDLAKLVYLYYPVADLILVLPSIILMYITSLFGPGRISIPWRYLSMGFMLITVSDLMYSYLGWRDFYGNGNLIDVGWHLGYLLIGMAGCQQKRIMIAIK
ncbi:MAG: hypothetical protein U0W24_09020 [Bacteroidales bacterium]